ncbi:transporter [Sulfurifustis variabilis]|uniref:Transporter n=1 Tax=Sulfurifustis variabilis TaxID=1675686 RepID=A0A1B4V3R0_9GAMM|nr:transporter [Sulfurifustis variabilis]
MTVRRTSIHGEWSSRWAFILAAAGSAIGLGNIWKFPYLAGEYGGGAFVLVYLLAVGIVGLPIMIAEILLGRRGRQSPINTMRTLAAEEGRSPHWQWLGWMGVLAGFLILSYYSVIGGWTFAYVVRMAGGLFAGATTGTVDAAFSALVSDPERLLAWHTLFMIMTMIVVARGVKSGLERAVRFMMPALFLILLLLVGYSMNTGYFTEGLRFLFAPDFARLTGAGVLAAMGQAFFSLSLGMGAIMVYGSYLPHTASIPRSAIQVAAADTTVALLAGVAIFPIIFANGLDPAQGAGLAFKSLPLAFGQMPGGSLFGALFFALLVFAAWTSAISLVEPAVAYLVENRGMNRVRACAWVGVTVWFLGLGTVFSFNLWSGATLFGLNFFEALDFLTSNVMLPLGGLLIAVFAAWRMSRKSTESELDAGPTGYRLWWVLVRYVTPVAVFIVLLHVTGLLGRLVG